MFFGSATCGCSVCKQINGEKQDGKSYFNTVLFAIRVKEIYKILKEECNTNESN